MRISANAPTSAESSARPVGGSGPHDLVRRLPRRPGFGPHRRAPPAGADPTLRGGDHQGVLRVWFDYSNVGCEMAARHPRPAATSAEPPMTRSPTSTEHPVQRRRGRRRRGRPGGHRSTGQSDCVPAGLSDEATAINSVATGLFNVLDSDIPHNAGSFRCVEVKLRESVVGIARHPTCCSMATTNVADRLVNATQPRSPTSKVWDSRTEVAPWVPTSP
ncbi:hydantoinase B/oxoprolinase family protein [Pseudonocardia sp. MCCB 268]|nr:hydantoinase B/oxoprolinase family protein [Pseudonocardia cytotoxica]